MNNKTHLGHTARKRFGQNFLCDHNVINNIVNAINPQPKQNLVEIGPGLGALTEPVAEICAEFGGQLTVIELDRDLAHRLRHHPFLNTKLNLIEGDAMQFDFTSLLQDSAQKLRIFGNLPYNISTPLMFHLFQASEVIADMHFMLQKEVVNRLVASPNSKAYGRLSVMTQYFCQVFPVLEVPPHAFKPAPKVDSAVVRLIPHPSKPAVAKDFKLFSQITTSAFNQRRKTIRNALGNYFSIENLSSLNIDPNLRAENLSVADFVILTNWLADRSKSFDID